MCRNCISSTTIRSTAASASTTCCGICRSRLRCGVRLASLPYNRRREQTAQKLPQARRHPAARQAARAVLEPGAATRAPPVRGAEGRPYRQPRSARDRAAAGVLRRSDQDRRRAARRAQGLRHSGPPRRRHRYRRRGRPALRERPVPALAIDDIDAALRGLVGRIRQRPPVYSALKRGGEPLYAKARRGEAIEVEERAVDVHAFELQSAADLLDGGEPLLRLHVECGSGTYVRSLVRDLGEALGCGAHVAELRRLWVDPFREPKMWSIEALQELAGRGGQHALDACLLPIESGMVAWPEVVVAPAQAARLGRAGRGPGPGPGRGWPSSTTAAARSGSAGSMPRPGCSRNGCSAGPAGPGGSRHPFVLRAGVEAAGRARRLEGRGTAWFETDLPGLRPANPPSPRTGSGSPGPGAPNPPHHERAGLGFARTPRPLVLANPSRERHRSMAAGAANALSAKGFAGTIRAPQNGKPFQVHGGPRGAPPDRSGRGASAGPASTERNA